jgi:hypothetical protein
MLTSTSILGLRSPIAVANIILSPSSLTLTLLPSDTDKSSPSPSPSPPSPPPTNPAQDEEQQQQQQPSPKALAIIALLSGTAGLAVMSAAQYMTGYLLLLSLFGPAGAHTYMKEFLRAGADVSAALPPAHLAARGDNMARDPRYAAVFVPLFCALGAALPEEALKYAPVAWLARARRARARPKEGDSDNSSNSNEKKQRRWPPVGNEKRAAVKAAAVKAAAAASLGFAAVELAAYVHAAASTPTPTGPSAAVTLLERILIALPGHLATAVLSASRGADADADAESSSSSSSSTTTTTTTPPSSGWRATLSAIAPSVVYHAVFDLILLESSALVGGHVGWVHPEGARAVVGTLGACLVVQGVLYVHTARAWLGWGRKKSRGKSE